MYILNFADALYTLQLDAYTVAPFLFGPLVIGHPGLRPHSHCNRVFSNTNYLSPAAIEWSGLDKESSPLQLIASRKLQSLISRPTIHTRRSWHIIINTAISYERFNCAYSRDEEEMLDQR